MSYHQDWLMRQIEAIAAMLAYMLTGKKTKQVTLDENQPGHTGTNLLASKLLALCRERKICEAENLLFAAMDDANPEAADAAVQFYSEINQLSDSDLEACNFSREEIWDGLKEICQHYGLNIF